MTTYCTNCQADTLATRKNTCDWCDTPLTSTPHVIPEPPGRGVFVVGALALALDATTLFHNQIESRA